MRDTGFTNGWFEKNDGKTFHCQIFPEIDLTTIKKELADPSGKRAFHPFRKTFNLEGRIVYLPASKNHYNQGENG